MEEEWKDIANFEGLYQVSNLGTKVCIDISGNTNNDKKRSTRISPIKD